jgi:WD40 repeat protein
VTASEDNTVRLWDSASGAEIAVLSGHEYEVNSAVFSFDGRRVVTASADDSARLWDTASGAEIAVLSGHDGTVKSAAFSPDGRRVVTASEDGTALLWRIFLDTQSLVDFAREAVPRELTPEQRKRYYLSDPEAER